MDHLLDNLNDPQREAVTTTDGPLLVLAGAGSGKTRVITRRAAYIASTVARPDEVLAITFTNKAAGEMRQRIMALFEEGGSHGGVASGAPWRPQGRGMLVCTFHSLCARLLREYANAVGMLPNFTILDESDRRSILRQVIEDCGLSADNWRPRTVEAYIGDAKNRLQTPADFAEQAGDFTEKTVARVYEAYQKSLRDQNAVDFDDLLMHVATMLRDTPSVTRELNERYRYLLIDEYQDTNHAQYLIATRLAGNHRNICCTGDPDQSIYGWRGADIRNILDFENDYPDAKTVRLEQNYRSTGAILSAASSLIAHNEQRKKKKLWTEEEFGAPIRVWECEDEHDEARRIASDIQSYVNEGGQAGDVAIFYRINAVTRVLEEALRSARIPYQIARGVEFYGRKEIKDLMAYLKAVVNPADEVSLVRAIGTPSRGIGKVTVEKIRDFARARGMPIGAALEVADSIEGIKAAAKKIAPFARFMRRLREMPQTPVQAIVETVLRESGLESVLGAEGTIDNDALQNAYELVSAAKQYDEESPNGSLAEWLHQISLVTDVDSVELSGGAVTLMTLHAAKGLEFSQVYLVGMEENMLPHARAVREGEGDIEEERRLAFVGITRARRCLTLTRARYRMIRGITERTMPSRFLSELPQDELEIVDFEREQDRSRAHLGRYNEYDDGEGIDVGRYMPGSIVRHPDYGEGRVVRLEPRGRSVYVRVRFDGFGERSFALDHASLEMGEA